MKSFIKTIGILCLAASLFSCKDKKDVKLESLEDSASFVLGFQSAAMWARQGVDTVNDKAFIAGYNAFDPDEEAYPLGLEQEQYVSLMQRFGDVLQKRYLEKFKPNIEKGEKFLSDNKAKKGVITTASGLQYEILNEGTGEKPNLYDTIYVNYTGTLLDGTVFDSNAGSEPIALPLAPGQLIQGWTEAFPLFKTGTKAKLYIPYDLAYGESGNQGIEPFSTLVFEVELVKIAKGKAPELDSASMKDLLQNVK